MATALVEDFAKAAGEVSEHAKAEAGREESKWGHLESWKFEGRGL